MVLEAPLHFTSRPGALTVRIAPRHPGSSPSADLPDSPVAAAARLVHLAAGRPAGRRPADLAVQRAHDDETPALAGASLHRGARI